MHAGLTPWAYYPARIADFTAAEPDAVLGALTGASVGNIDRTQVEAWRIEVKLLQQSLVTHDGIVCLEFDVPPHRQPYRRRRRVIRCHRPD